MPSLGFEKLPRGKHPTGNPVISPLRRPGHSHAMQTNGKMKALKFGDPIATVYEACGKRTEKIFKMKTYKTHFGITAMKRTLQSLVLVAGLVFLGHDAVAGPAPVPLGSA